MLFRHSRAGAQLPGKSAAVLLGTESALGTVLAWLMVIRGGMGELNPREARYWSR